MNQATAITRADLMSLEQYAKERPAFRQQVLQHKKSRQVALGPNATLYFEDRQTLLYQIQEILRIEKVFEVDGINDELEAYNPMLPSGRNFKATFMIEYTDAVIRAAQLEKMVGIEDLVWIKIDGFDKVWSIADEDLERSNATKTSAVHFMRFEMSDGMSKSIKAGSSWVIGVQHPNYTYEYQVEGDTRNCLKNDLA